MIFADSRYSQSFQAFLPDREGTLRRVVNPPSFYPATFAARQHVVRTGERLDMLAAKYFGDPERWWAIAAANPEVFYPEDLVAGSILRIPDATPVR